MNRTTARTTRWCAPTLAGCIFSAILLIGLTAGCSSSQPAPSPGYSNGNSADDSGDEANNRNANRSNVARNAGGAFDSDY